MGLSNPFQLFSLFFALFKLLFLTCVIYDRIDTCRLPGCGNDGRAIFIVIMSLMMLFPIVLIIGILKSNLQLLRVCKVYNIVEKSAIVFLQIAAGLFMGGLIANHFRHMSDKDRISVYMMYAIDFICILLVILYTIFRNWLYAGLVESVKQDIAKKRNEQFVLA